VPDRAKGLGARAGRTLTRYSEAGGSVLAGGIAYSAIFSLFSLMTLAFTALAHLLGHSPAMMASVEGQLNAWLPGLLNTGHGGLISPDALVRSHVLSIAGIVASIVLIWSGLSFFSALQTGLRAVFGLTPARGGAWRNRLAAALGFAVLGVALICSSAVGVVASSASSWAAHTLPVPDSAVLFRWAGYALSLVIDAGAVAALFTVVAGARPARRDLVFGALAAGVAMGLIRHLGTTVVTGSSANALLASATTLVTLLVWINLMARVTLYAAAWTAASAASPAS
jgi:membrane protein